MWISINGEEWRLTCGMCKWFNIKADMDGVDSTCRRLDHKHLKFSKPFFKCYDCGQSKGSICKEFKPASWVKALHDKWNEFDGFAIPTGTVGIVVDGDNSIVYRVKCEDFFNNTFLDENNNLRWIEREYLKMTRNASTGYKLIHEKAKEKSNERLG